MSNSTETATIIHSLYNSRVNLLQQLEYIGFNTSEYKSFNIHQIDAMYKEKQLDFILEDTEETERVYVKYHFGSLRSGTLNTYVGDLFGNGVDSDDNIALQPGDALIVLVDSEPNDSLREAMMLLYNRSKIYVSVMNIARLQYNVLQHELVPSVVPIRSKEKLAVLKDVLRINNLRQLPEISRFDPMAMAILLRPGEVAHITRKSPTAQKTEYWRVCV